ncbi:MAG: class II aldolase/adducin family protein [Elusimicrobiota bacterium]
MRPPTEAWLRQEIVRVGKRLSDKDFAPGSSGNISARLGEGLILITPTGVGKGDLRADDIVVVDLDGRKVRGSRTPTSELEMHRAVYAMRPDARAVVHAHPPIATAFACAGVPLDKPLASEFVMSVGSAPLAPYATPGTQEVPASLGGLVKDHDAVLLANHGVVTLGPTLFDAFAKMETVEHFARITLAVRQLGQEKLLREEEVRKLVEAGVRYSKECQDCPHAPYASRDEQALARIIDEVLKKL